MVCEGELGDEASGVLAEQIRCLRHRGPDESGQWRDHHCALGHARLSIIDLTAGRQPMANEDGTVRISYNGEVYNYRELMAELKAKGHRFSTRSDTETIVHAWEQWGPACVERLRGMFAFAIWDGPQRRLFLARDRLGIKPLYYYASGGRLVFGSEIKACLADPGVPRRIDSQALYDYLCYLYVPAPKTMFAGIRKLPAGHTLDYHEGRVEIKRYWDLTFSGEPVGDESAVCEVLLDKLREAVEIRLMSEVPLGAFLSGGIDSSAVVWTMSKLLDRPVTTNSIGFSDQAFNELPHADALAERLGTDHHRYVVTPRAAEVVETLATHYDEPFADSSAVPTYYVSQMARQNVTVALSGDGGDENFAGYRRYLFDRAEAKVRRFLPGMIRRGVFGPLGRIWPKADWLPRPLRFKSTFGNLATDEAHGHFRTVCFLDRHEAFSAMAGDMQRAVGDYDPVSVLEEHFRRVADCPDPVSRCQYVDMKTYLVDDILTKVDRASMAVSLEVRVPLLDHEFMQYAATLPSGLKLRGGVGKYIFKQALRGPLGPEIVDRTKMGFSIPLADWFRKDLKRFTEERLLLPDARIAEWLDRDMMHRVWNEHQGGRRNWQELIWAALMLELWARRWKVD